ncbi:unnamed protein product [Amoebophrya sp. A120]|nr:unnamed protein product [Amoebophrya sp. A120]|eukprot:GSA120T00000473001.1
MTTSSSSSSSPWPSRLADYGPLEVELGRGQQCVVYRGRWQDRWVALKVVQKANLRRAEAEKLQNEIVVHSQLQHLHVLDIYHAFEDAEQVVLVLEHATPVYCHNRKDSPVGCLRTDAGPPDHRRPGRPTAAPAPSRGRFTEARLRVLLSEVLKALQYLHGLRYHHGAVRTENLLHVEGVGTKLSDFSSVARFQDPRDLREERGNFRGGSTGGDIFASPRTSTDRPSSSCTKPPKSSSFRGEAQDLFDLGTCAVQLLLDSESTVDPWVRNNAFPATVSKRCIACLEQFQKPNATAEGLLRQPFFLSSLAIPRIVYDPRNEDPGSARGGLLLGSSCRNNLHKKANSAPGAHSVVAPSSSGSLALPAGSTAKHGGMVHLRDVRGRSGQTRAVPHRGAGSDYGAANSKPRIVRPVMPYDPHNYTDSEGSVQRRRDKDADGVSGQRNSKARREEPPGAAPRMVLSTKAALLHQQKTRNRISSSHHLPSGKVNPLAAAGVAPREGHATSQRSSRDVPLVRPSAPPAIGITAASSHNSDSDLAHSSSNESGEEIGLQEVLPVLLGDETHSTMQIGSCQLHTSTGQFDFEDQHDPLPSWQQMMQRNSTGTEHNTRLVSHPFSDARQLRSVISNDEEVVDEDGGSFCTTNGGGRQVKEHPPPVEVDLDPDAMPEKRRPTSTSLHHRRRDIAARNYGPRTVEAAGKNEVGTTMFGGAAGSPARTPPSGKKSPASTSRGVLPHGGQKFRSCIEDQSFIDEGALLFDKRGTELLPEFPRQTAGKSPTTELVFDKHRELLAANRRSCDKLLQENKCLEQQGEGPNNTKNGVRSNAGPSSSSSKVSTSEQQHQNAAKRAPRAREDVFSAQQPLLLSDEPESCFEQTEEDLRLHGDKDNCHDCNMDEVDVEHGTTSIKSPLLQEPGGHEHQDPSLVSSSAANILDAEQLSPVTNRHEDMQTSGFLLSNHVGDISLTHYLPGDVGAAAAMPMSRSSSSSRNVAVGVNKNEEDHHDNPAAGAGSRAETQLDHQELLNDPRRRTGGATPSSSSRAKFDPDGQQSNFAQEVDHATSRKHGAGRVSLIPPTTRNRTRLAVQHDPSTDHEDRGTCGRANDSAMDALVRGLPSPARRGSSRQRFFGDRPAGVEEQQARGTVSNGTAGGAAHRPPSGTTSRGRENTYKDDRKNYARNVAAPPSASNADHEDQSVVDMEVEGLPSSNPHDPHGGSLPAEALSPPVPAMHTSNLLVDTKRIKKPVDLTQKNGYRFQVTQRGEVRIGGPEGVFVIDPGGVSCRLEQRSSSTASSSEHNKSSAAALGLCPDLNKRIQAGEKSRQALIRKYASYQHLPAFLKHWYQFAFTVVNQLRARTPKVILHYERCRCELMDNVPLPDFVVHFHDTMSTQLIRYCRVREGLLTLSTRTGGSTFSTSRKPVGTRSTGLDQHEPHMHEDHDSFFTQQKRGGLLSSSASEVVADLQPASSFEIPLELVLQAEDGAAKQSLDELLVPYQWELGDVKPVLEKVVAAWEAARREEKIAFDKSAELLHNLHAKTGSAGFPALEFQAEFERYQRELANLYPVVKRFDYP